MNDAIPSGRCQCGCGAITRVARQNRPERGIVKGQPNRFVQGHHNGPRKPPVTKSGIGHPKWRGGSYTSPQGYIKVLVPGHPRAHGAGYVFEHILIAERALGKPLPPAAEVHHVNERKGDNRNRNLVVCQDIAYHRLLHQRQRALRACGNASYRKCSYCTAYDAPANLRVQRHRAWHKECLKRHLKGVARQPATRREAA